MPTGSAEVRKVQDTSIAEGWKHGEGQVVDGKFQLGRFLGGSEHSAVFLTRTEDQEPVAIKLIPADSGQAELQLSRWQQAAALSNPHLIRLLQTGRCGLGGQALLYVVMEYAPENLAQILPQRPLTPAEVQEMLPPVLDALAFLHGNGLVHGHLKPANIMAIGDQLKLSTDGICAVGEAAGAEPPGAYDPPEAATAPKLPAADIWSLGVTIVQALTQQKPSRDLVLPGTPALAESLPAPFGDIARQCLVADPQHRCTLADIAAQLRPTPTATQPARKAVLAGFGRRRYLVPALVVGLAVLAIAFGTRLFRQPSQAQVTSARETVKVQGQKKPGARAARPARKPANDNQRASAPVAAKPSPAKVVTGSVVHQVLPDVPQSARNTIQGSVRVIVRVQVNPAGDVTAADFDSRGPSRYFARLAMQAARQWKFEPPTANGQKAASVWVLRFEFRRTGTRAVPARAS